MIKVITHAGQHHADEVLTIALLKRFFNVTIERKFVVTDEEMNSVNTYVLDVGRKFEPQLNNYDHHHNAELPATNILVLDSLAYELDMEGRVDVADILYRIRPFFLRVSEIDKGTPSLPTEFNTMIRDIDTFEDALEFASHVLDNVLKTAVKAQTDEKTYYNLPIIGNVRLQEQGTPLVGWKELCLKDGLKGLVTPNPRGGWQCISVDSELYPIAEQKNQTYLHNSKFLAVYKTQEEALKAL